MSRRSPAHETRPGMLDGTGSTRALLVEDDPNIVDLIRSNLSVRGFDTIVSADGRRALQLLETEAPDIVLLDLMLPGADGFELCRQIRERSAVGIIVVSARGGERDKVTALHVGADDYLTKPFSIEELLARIVATLRRTRPVNAPEVAPQVLVVGDIVIDLAGPDADRVRAAEGAGHQSGQAAHPRPPAAAGVGPGIRDPDRVRARLRQAAARQAGGGRRPAADSHPSAGRLPDGAGMIRE